jgi:hypothetical protein
LGACLVLATDGRRRQASRILDRVGWREKTLRANCPCTLKQTLRRLVAPPEGHPATAQWKTVAARIHGANLYGQPAARSVHGEFTLQAIFDRREASALQ